MEPRLRNDSESAVRSGPGNGKAPRRDVMVLGGAILAVNVLHSAADDRFLIHDLRPSALLYHDLNFPSLPLTRRDTPHNSGLRLRRRSFLRAIETASILDLLNKKHKKRKLLAKL